MINPEQESQLFATLETIAEQDPLEPYHQKALELEGVINSFDVNDEEISVIAEAAIKELDSSWPYMGDYFTVEGLFYAPSEDGNTDHSEQGISAPKRYDFTTIRGDATGKSLGFTTSHHIDESGQPHISIHHLLEVTRRTQSEPQYYRTIQETVYIRVPIDGKAILTLPESVAPPNLRSLEYHYGDVISEIDDAVYNYDTINDRLHTLANLEIEKGPFFDEASEEAILRYLNDLIPFDHPLPYTISAFDLFYKPSAGSLDYKPHIIEPHVKLSGTITSFSFIDCVDLDREAGEMKIDGTRRRLALDTHIPLDRKTYTHVVIPLSDTIMVSEIEPYDI